MGTALQSFIDQAAADAAAGVNRYLDGITTEAMLCAGHVVKIRDDMRRQRERFHLCVDPLPYGVADDVRRDAQRLHTISEHECNGVLERVEDEGRTDHRGRPMIVGKVYAVTNINGPGPLHYYRTPDREMPARARIEKAAAAIGAVVEFQGDPRGWPVMLRLSDGRTISPPVR